MGYRIYISGKYHSYHKTKALAKAAIEKALRVTKRLGSTPRPKMNVGGSKRKADGLGSSPRPKVNAGGLKRKADGQGSTPRPKVNAGGLRRKADGLGSIPRPKTNPKKEAGLGSTPRPKTNPKKDAVMFKGLVARFSKRAGRWTYRGFVRKPGSNTKTYVGTSQDQRYVASMIAEAKGVTEGQTLRKKCERRSVAEAMHRFRVLTSSMEGWVPRDITGAVQRRGQAASMIVQAPGVYVAFLYGREHSWRDAVLKTWAATGAVQRLCIVGLDSNDEKLQWEASKTMHTILGQAFSEWARETKSNPEQRLDWKSHVDRNVGYHLSLTAWGLREGLLMKTSQARSSLGVKNKQGEWYGLHLYDRQEHLGRMLHMHRLGRVLLQTKVPHTNREWLESIEGFGKRCAELGINSGQKEDNYQFWWLCRIYLIVEMRHQGIEKLRVTANWNKDEVASAMVPDMNEWLSTWMSSKYITSLKVLLSRLAYREPLEMLSCFCCIMGDNDIDRYSTDALESAWGAFGKQRRVMRRASAFKDDAHPAFIIRKVMDDRGES